MLSGQAIRQERKFLFLAEIRTKSISKAVQRIALRAKSDAEGCRDPAHTQTIRHYVSRAQHNRELVYDVVKDLK